MMDGAAAGGASLGAAEPRVWFSLSGRAGPRNTAINKGEQSRPLPAAPRPGRPRSGLGGGGGTRRHKEEEVGPEAPSRGGDSPGAAAWPGRAPPGPAGARPRPGGSASPSWGSCWGSPRGAGRGRQVRGAGDGMGWGWDRGGIAVGMGGSALCSLPPVPRGAPRPRSRPGAAAPQGPAGWGGSGTPAGALTPRQSSRAGSEPPSRAHRSPFLFGGARSGFCCRAGPGGFCSFSRWGNTRFSPEAPVTSQMGAGGAEGVPASLRPPVASSSSPFPSPRSQG